MPNVGMQAGKTAGLADGVQFAAQRLTPRRIWVESPLFLTELDIYWMPPPFLQNQYPSGYNVWRGESPLFAPDSPQWTKLTASPVAVPMYRDTTVIVQRVMHYYYVVTAVMRNGTETPIDRAVTLYENDKSAPQFPVISPLRIYREYRRRKYIILNNDAERVDLLIRRQAGTRCECFNGKYEQTGDPNCPRCYGTSWDRGYEILRDVKMRIETVEETLRLQAQGLQLRSDPRAWLVDFPILRNGDIVLRRNGWIYEIDKVDFVTHAGFITEQNFDINKLPPTHPVYNYSVPASDAP